MDIISWSNNLDKFKVIIAFISYPIIISFVKVLIIQKLTYFGIMFSWVFDLFFTTKFSSPPLRAGALSKTIETEEKNSIIIYKIKMKCIYSDNDSYYPEKLKFYIEIMIMKHLIYVDFSHVLQFVLLYG